LTVPELPNNVRKQTVQQDEHSRRDRRRHDTAEQQVRHIPAKPYIQHGQSVPVRLQNGFQIKQNHDNRKNRQNNPAGRPEH
jgi:hypothetical protein